MKLPIKNKEEVENLIRSKSKEKIDLLKDLEKCLLNIRGYIFKMPKSGTPVVVGMSGGADTTTTTAILMHEFGLVVYPFFINRGQRVYKYEKESIEFFSEMFSKKYGKLFHRPIEISVPIPASEIKNDLTDKLRHDVGHPMRNSIITEYGVQYAYSLENKGVHARDIFCSVVSSDGNYVYHSTLTALRSQMLHVVTDMGDPEWQITSIAIEKELGFYFDKDVLVKWAHEHKLPLEKTRTCVESGEIHCGICECCYDRKKSFENAGIEDKTEYKDTRSSSLLRSKNVV